MTKTAKIWLTIIIVIVVAAVIWILFAGSPAQAPTAMENNSSAVSVPTGAATGLTTKPTDASNSALEKDLNSVNSQMNNLGADASNAAQ